MKAYAIQAISVLSVETLPNGVQVLMTTCQHYEVFQTLPHAVTFEGVVFGRTGWNSDRRIAYYRTDAPIATYGEKPWSKNI